MLDEEAAEAEAATYLERRLDAMARCLEDRDAQQRQKQAIECELHLRDLRKRHMPLQDISNAVAARVRARAGVRPGELANWLLQSRSTPFRIGLSKPNQLRGDLQFRDFGSPLKNGLSPDRPDVTSGRRRISRKPRCRSQVIVLGRRSNSSARIAQMAAAPGRKVKRWRSCSTGLRSW
jgi:hypothetical protein